jgi:hypothetical protein
MRQGKVDNGHPLNFLLNAAYGWPAGGFFNAQPRASGNAFQKQAYGNYAFGVYMVAAGVSLSRSSSRLEPLTARADRCREL